MKLYYYPGACSLAPHIVLREAGIGFELDKVDLTTKKTESGADYNRVNPRGYVPTLQLDNGEFINEVSVIVQYLADLKPETGLAPKPGTMERTRLQEWLGFIATELHKQYSPLFYPTTPQETRQFQIEKLTHRYDHVAQKLDGKPYLLGEKFSPADAYLFTVSNWAGMLKLDLPGLSALKPYMTRIGERPAVQAALKAEGLAQG